MNILLIILLLIVVDASAYASTDKNRLFTDEATDIQEKTITIYRVTPDSVTPVQVKIEYKDTQDIEDQLSDICAAYTENDREMQQYLSNITLGNASISFIKSRGRGIIYKVKIPIIVKRLFKKFPNLPPYNRIIYIHVIHARYRRDQKAYSIINPILRGNETIINGPHSIDIIGFIGYTTWVGLIAERGVILRCGLAGYGVVKPSS